MAVADGWAGVAVWTKEELRAPPQSLGNEPTRFISCYLDWLALAFLLLQEDGRGLWDMFGAPDIAIF